MDEQYGMFNLKAEVEFNLECVIVKKLREDVKNHSFVCENEGDHPLAMPEEQECID